MKSRRRNNVVQFMRDNCKTIYTYTFVECVRQCVALAVQFMQCDSQATKFVTPREEDQFITINYCGGRGGGG